MMSDASENFSDEDDGDYYKFSDNDEPALEKDEKKDDPEYFNYEEMTSSGARKLLEQAIENLSNSLKLHKSVCEILLASHMWNENYIKRACERDYVKALSRARVITSILDDESGGNNNHSAVPPNVSWPITTVILTNSKRGALCGCCYLEASLPTGWNVSSSSSQSNKNNTAINRDDFLKLYSLLCADHYFCLNCWRQYLHHQLNDNSFSHNYHAIAFECMGHQCHVRIPHNFAQWVLQETLLDCDYRMIQTSTITATCTTTNPTTSHHSNIEFLPCYDKYEAFLLHDLLTSHPYLRKCPTTRCTAVFRAIAPLVVKRDIWSDVSMDAVDNKTTSSSSTTTTTASNTIDIPLSTTKSGQLQKPFSSLRVHCTVCDIESCFLCGGEYHAPTDCDTLIQWTKKCLDDSETANYISAHTKDCPRCHVCIEKSGGCNHMSCAKCSYNFCWMCLGDWKSHSAEYYECSRYRENPNVANETQHIMARKALKKYIFYYERWANHEKSLRLENEQSERIRQRINLKVNNKEGTWIDWQYLLTASDTLRRCRNTLKHTYPFAFYMDRGPHKDRKELFEYKQGLLEAEVENLSWKIEHAEISDRGGLEQKMDVCEKHRKALLHEFFMP